MLRVLIASLIAAWAASAHAETVTVDTWNGATEAPKDAKVIVALDVAVIDNMAAIGVQPAGMPSPHFVPELDKIAKKAAKVGSLFEPDYEELARLAPDLIIAGGRSSTKVEPLSRIAPTIDFTIWGDNHVEQALARLEGLGRITGREDAAAILTEAFNERLAKAQEAVSGKGAALILMTNGPKVSAFGAGSRFGWLHVAIGLPEAAPGVDDRTHGEAISFEFIADVDPDWLLVVDRGAAIGASGQGAQATLDNALIAKTKAWKNGNVVYLDAVGIYIAGGGIPSMMRTLDDMIAAFSASE